MLHVTPQLNGLGPRRQKLERQNPGQHAKHESHILTYSKFKKRFFDCVEISAERALISATMGGEEKKGL